MKNIKWLFYRLQAMSGKEIIYRIYKTSINKKNRIKYSSNYYITEFMKDKKINLNKIDSNLEKVFKLPSIDNSGDFDNFQYKVFNKVIDINSDINWHEGMHSNWDENMYSMDIDFKNKDEIGDIRYTWEINRHQFMPPLALKYKITKSEKYYKLLVKHFDSWINSNPFLKGVSWASPMEISIRAYQWLIVFYLLKDEDKEEFREKLIKCIIFSMEYVSKNISSYSSANNHLIIEAYMCSMVGYFIKDVYKQTWFEDNYKLLETQVVMQFYKDGVNKEQALHYHAFVVEGILQYNFFLKKIEEEPISEEIIKNSLIFMGSLEVNNKNYEFGDSDDAKLITLDLKKNNYYEYVLMLGSIYYDVLFIEFNKILPVVNMISGVEKAPEKKYKYKSFDIYKDGGYGVIKTEVTSLLFDFGKLGMGSLAAHGHSDSLSFIYYYKNHPVFIDPGTFIYNIDEKMRNYFRNTNMHNTLCLNNENQSEIKGPFLWGKKAETKLLDYLNDEKIYRIIAEHNGYHPSIHKRKLKFIKNIEMLVIEDFFNKPAEVNFILHPECKVLNINENFIEMSINNEKLFLYADGIIEINNIKVSNKFLSLCDSQKISIKYDFSINNKLVTILSTRKEDIENYINKE